MKRFFLVHDQARHLAQKAVAEAPEGYVVKIDEPKRNMGQNDRFHAMCGDIARTIPFGKKMRTLAEWKVLLVSGHANVTAEGSEIVAGLEGEFVNLRESTALMSKKRSSSLIDYTRALGDLHGVKWTEPPFPE